MRAAESTTARRRALVQAARHWQSGYPHRAWETLADAGMTAEYPIFVRVAVRHARARFNRRINRR